MSSHARETAADVPTAPVTEPILAEEENSATAAPGDTSDSGSEYDSVYSSDAASLTETLKSTVKKWQFENNRRYHAYKKGEWIVPNDDQQQEQMDIFHEVYTRTIAGKLYLAPIGSGAQKVLDLGTGTGIWAVLFAEKHPEAHVIGNDLSPIQPDWVPPNCSFEVDDFNETWAYKPQSFDFVHARALHGAVSDWQKFADNTFKVLKPGGWFEMCGEITEFHSDDGTLPEKSHIQEWMANVHKATELSGKTLNGHQIIEDCLAKAGFDQKTYKQQVFKMPVGTWPKDTDGN